MKKLRHFFAGTLPIALASLFIAVVVTIQLPIEIYTSNTEEFTTPITSLVMTIAIAFCAVFLLFFSPGLFPFKTYRSRYFSFLATLGILMWLTAHFAFGNYGEFDGRGLTIAASSPKAIIEALLWIILLGSSIFFSSKIFKLQLQAISGLLIIAIAFTGFKVFQHSQRHNIMLEEVTSTPAFLNEEFLTFSNQANILHILLDEQQSTIMEKMLEKDPAFAKSLDGFTFFPDTAGNFPSTILAMPAILSGKVYKNESNRSEFSQRILSANPFLTTLENANYSTHLHTTAEFCTEGKLKNCTPTPGLSGTNSAFLLLDYSLFRAVPDMLKPRIYREEDWLLTRKFINPNYYANFAGLSHLSFLYFNQHLQVKDIGPTYKFYHTFITHSPMVVDAECNLRTQRVHRFSLEGRLDQTACVFGHIFTLLEKLKQEDIYDKTIIIISSDHGGRYPVPEQQKGLAERNMKFNPHSSALATLLIKPLNSHGHLRISPVPASLSDIPNTLLGMLELPLLEDGENIFSLSETQERVREFVYYGFSPEPRGEDEDFPITIFNIKGDVREASSWSYQCSDEAKLGYNRCSP